MPASPVIQALAKILVEVLESVGKEKCQEFFSMLNEKYLEPIDLPGLPDPLVDPVVAKIVPILAGGGYDIALEKLKELANGGDLVVAGEEVGDLPEIVSQLLEALIALAKELFVWLGILKV